MVKPDNDTHEARQGSVDETTGPRFLAIGRVVRPHGVRGEVRAEVYTELPERFNWLDTLFLSRDPDDTAAQGVSVESTRFHKGYVLVKLGGIDSRNDAEMLRGMWLLVPIEEGIPLEEDEVYHFQLEGLAVYTDEGEHLGVLDEVLETGANEVFVVTNGPQELLLPNTEEVVLEVDWDARRMIVHLIPGLRS